LDKNRFRFCYLSAFEKSFSVNVISSADIFFEINQMIISKNPQFTGISARQQLEFTTHLLLTD